MDKREIQTREIESDEYLDIEDKYIYFNKHSMSIKNKLIWTARLWFGFEQSLKVKNKLLIKF